MSSTTPPPPSTLVDDDNDDDVVSQLPPPLPPKPQEEEEVVEDDNDDAQQRPPSSLYGRGTFRDRASRRGSNLLAAAVVDNGNHRHSLLPSTLLGISQAALFASKLSAARLSIEKKKKLLSTPLNTVHQRNVGPYTVIAFLNTGSGGGEAGSVQASFRDLLGSEFVYDLHHCNPELILRQYALDPFVRIVACGGDGTMGWIESATDAVWDDLLADHPELLHHHDENDKSSSPPYTTTHLPLAIVPLGTGNDLSRTLGWGSEYRPYMKSRTLLQQVVSADIGHLDRWRCVIVPETQVDAATKESIPAMLGQRMKRETSEAFLAAPPSSFVSSNRSSDPAAADNATVFDGVFCNYFGIGLDSEIALAFHRERAAHPEKFTSPLANKLVYVKKALTHWNGPSLLGRVRIVVSKDGGDYVELPIPKRCRSIVLLNIDSYAAGTKLARGGRHDDQLIEVIFCPGIGRLGLARAGARIRPAATVDRVLIKTIEVVPCQVDGEPWSQPPSMISVRLECQRPVLTPPSAAHFWSCQSGGGAAV